MSDWKAKQSPSPTNITNAGQTSSGLFAPVNPYQEKRAAEHAAAAVEKVSTAFKESFNLCDRLQRPQVFKTAQGEIPMKDGVMGAMGENATQLLNLNPSAPECRTSPGLGMSNSNHGPEVES